MAIASKHNKHQQSTDVGDTIVNHNPIGVDITDKDNTISTSRIVDIDSRIINQRAYIEKGNWSIDYYGQVKKEDDLASNLDMLNSIVGNNYYHIKDLNIKVTTPMVVGEENVSFSAVIPTTLYPIIGDVIVAKTIAGMLGMFRITNKKLNTYTSDPVYTIEARLDRLVRDDPAIFEQLKTKVIREYTTLDNGVIVKDNDYTQYQDVTESFLSIKDHYIENFIESVHDDIPFDPLAQALLTKVVSYPIHLPNYVSTHFLKGTIYDSIVNIKSLSFVTKRDYEIAPAPRNLGRLHFRFKNAMIKQLKVVMPIKSTRETHQLTTYDDELVSQPEPVVVDKYVKDYRLQDVPTIVGTPVVAVIGTTTITYINNGKERVEIRERILTVNDKPVIDGIAHVDDREVITITQTFEYEIINNIPTDNLKLIKQVIETKYIDLQGNSSTTVRTTDLSMKDFDKTICLSPIVAKITKHIDNVVITQITPIPNPQPISNTVNDITVTTLDGGNVRTEIVDTQTYTQTRVQHLELWGNQIGVVSETIDTVYKDGVTPTTHVEYLNEDAYKRTPIVLQVVIVEPPIVLEPRTVQIDKSVTIQGNDSAEYKEITITEYTCTTDQTKNETKTETRTQIVDISVTPLLVNSEQLRTVISYADNRPDLIRDVPITPVSDLIKADESIVSNTVNGITITTYDNPFSTKEVKVDVTGTNKVTTTRVQTIDLTTGTINKEIKTVVTENSAGEELSREVEVITENIVPIVLQVVTHHVPVIVQLTHIDNPTPITNAVGNTVVTTIDNGNQRTEIVYHGTYTVTRIQDLVLSDNILTVTNEVITTVYSDGVTPTTNVVSVLPVPPITLQIQQPIPIPAYVHLNPTISRPIVPTIYYNGYPTVPAGFIPNDFVGVPTTPVEPEPEVILPLAITRHPLLPQHEAGDRTYLVSSKFYQGETDTLFEKALLQLILNEKLTNIEALLAIYMDLTDTEQYTYGPYLLSLAKYWAYDRLHIDLN